MWQREREREEDDVVVLFWQCRVRTSLLGLCPNVIAPHWSGHDLFALHDDAHLQHTGFTTTKSSLPWTCKQHSCHC